MSDPRAERRIRARRLQAQLLGSRRAGGPAEVVGHLLAVQGQDTRGFRLAIRARGDGATAGDVDRALTEDRSLVVTWLHRGTLHLVRAEDYWWLHPLTTPQLATGIRRRLREEGVSTRVAEEALGLIADAVADGPRTRDELRATLDHAGIPVEGQAHYLLLTAASQERIVVRGPVVDGEHAYVAPAAWLGAPPPALDEDEGLARLARRYLRSHGPATAKDLAAWAGITLGAARRGFEAVDDEVEPADGGVVVRDASSPRALMPPPRLLGPFDPVLHGWRSRAWVAEDHGREVVLGGVFRPSVLVDGRVVGTWKLERRRLAVRLLEDVSDRHLAALRREASDVLRFLDLGDRDTVIL